MNLSLNSTILVNGHNQYLQQLPLLAGQRLFILHGSTCFQFILLHSVKCFSYLQLWLTSLLEALWPCPAFRSHLRSHLRDPFLSLLFELTQDVPSLPLVYLGKPLTAHGCSFWHLLNLFSLCILFLRVFCIKWSWQRLMFKISQWCS